MLVDYSLGLTPTPTINQVNVVHLYNTHSWCPGDFFDHVLGLF